MKHTLTRLTALLLAPNCLLPVVLASEARTNRLVTTIDCTKDYGPDAYFGFSDVRATQSAAGKYREAGLAPESRFGYRFAVEQVGRPHLAVIRYPDDKNRCMAIMDGQFRAVLPVLRLGSHRCFDHPLMSESGRTLTLPTAAPNGKSGAVEAGITEKG